MKTSNISQGRINQEIRTMSKQKLPYLHAMPLQNDIYTWHFTFQGPQNTAFHEGLYHGQILLPYEYPFKPPDIVFMNKNGRFQVNKKICLTITQYHPEQWNSAWTIRTMLEAVISLFNQNIVGIGYEESNEQVREFLAKESHKYSCEKCGALVGILKPRQPRDAKSKEENRPVIKSETKVVKEQAIVYQYMQKKRQMQQPPPAPKIQNKLKKQYIINPQKTILNPQKTLKKPQLDWKQQILQNQSELMEVTSSIKWIIQS